MDLSTKYPVLTIVGKEWKSALQNVLHSISRMHDKVVEAVNSKQDEDGELDIEYTSSAVGAPPVPASGNAVFWEDTTNSKYYLVFSYDGVNTVKVELT